MAERETYLGPEREKEMLENIREHLDVLSEKTINFEDFVSELFGKGCLSVDEKFKVLSGVVEEKSTNKTTQGKCGELYATLLRKEIPWSTVLECWRETGNDYLSGRFDTYLVLEGRDSSKSQKLSKFKSLPHNRSEFITHLHLIHLQIAPKSLLKSLRKSTKLQSIILENVKIPHGGRVGDDPSAEFDQTVPLPNLKEFHMEELVQDKPFRSVKEVNSYLDELNMKAIMFFTTSVNHVIQSKISVSIRLRGATILKMIPKNTEEGSQSEPPGLQFVSMLRRRPDQCGGVVNMDSWSKVALYECFVPKNNSFSSLLTHLNIYRCKITNYDPYVRNCTQLKQLHICSEFDYDEFKLAEMDICSLNECRNSLKQLSLGFVHLTKSNASPMIKLNLDSLNLNCCQLASESLTEFYELFQHQKNIVWRCGSPHPSPTFLQGALTNTATDFIAVSHFNWDTNDPHFETVKAFLKSTGPPSIVGDEDKFIFRKSQAEWTCSDPRDEDDAQFSIYTPSAWNVLSPDPKSWFDLPLTSSTKQNKEIEYPHTIFCKVKN